MAFPQQSKIPCRNSGLHHHAAFIFGYSWPAGQGYLKEFARAVVQRWSHILGAAFLQAAALLWPAVVPAADFPSAPRAAPVVVPAAPSYAYDPNRFEIRFGALAHGVGGWESGTVDLSADVVTPRLWAVAPVWWDFLVPRLRFGGAVNLDGRTSFAYVDALWSVPLAERWFAESFIGPAVHNGKLAGEPGRFAQLGCSALFHAGGSIGFVPIPRWSVIATFEHLSNGNSVVGTNCPQNQGLNNYGLKIGYSF